MSPIEYVDDDGEPLDVPPATEYQPRQIDSITPVAETKPEIDRSEWIRRFVESRREKEGGPAPSLEEALPGTSQVDDLRAHLEGRRVTKPPAERPQREKILTEEVWIRVKPSEKARWNAVAEEMDMSLSEAIRTATNQWADEIEGATPEPSLAPIGDAQPHHAGAPAGSPR